MDAVGQFCQGIWDVQAVGNYVYAANNTGLTIFDISNPAEPRCVASCNLPSTAMAVTVVGDRAYVADTYSGLEIIDIAEPTAPSLVGSYDTPGCVNDVVAVGDRAYIVDETQGLQILDISNPASPSPARKLCVHRHDDASGRRR